MTPEMAPEAAALPSSGGRDANLKLQLSFFVAVACGLASAIASDASDYQWIGFAGPLISILAFCGFGLSQGFAARSDTRQQFADSCYFLGFLLTMVAMLVGFLPAGLFGAEITSQGILRHFSMALGATALGLVCRILALQGGRSLGQISAEVETSLSQYARKVSNEAKIIGGELAVLREELERQQRQAGTIVTTTIRDAVHTAFEPIGHSIAAISEQLGTQSAAIVRSAGEMQSALNRSGAQLSAAAEVKAEAETAARAAIASVGDALQRFESRIDGLRDQLTGLVETASGEIEKMTTALSGATALAPELGRAIDAAAANVGVAAQNLDGLAAKATALSRRVDITFGDGDDVLARVGTARDGLVARIGEAGAQASDSIAQEGESARGAIRQAQLDFTTGIESERQRALDSIRGDAKAFSQDIEAATERLALILKSFSARIEEARR